MPIRLSLEVSMSQKLPDSHLPKYILEDDKKDSWKILIVDDEEEVHTITEVILKEFSYENKSVSILNSTSVEHAKSLLKSNRDIAIVLLDIYLEGDESGLELIKYIREELRNRLTRIILRTSQQGEEPAIEIIKNYDINDYKAKIDLNSNKLTTTIISSLRSYQDILLIEMNRIGLNRILFFSIFMLQQKEIEPFLLHAAHELTFLGNDPFGKREFEIEAFFCKKENESDEFEILHRDKNAIKEKFSKTKLELIERVIDRSEFFRKNNLYLFPYKTSKSKYILYFETDKPFDRVRLDLLSTYFSVISASINNIELHTEINNINKNLEDKVAQQTKELKLKNEELIQLIDAKKNLLRVMYRDLNNTLGVMMPAAEMAMDLGENQWGRNKHLWEKVHKSLLIQKEIIDQVRDIDAMRSGKKKLEMKAVDIAEVIEKANFLFKDRINEKELTFSVVWEEGLENIKVLAEPVSFSNSVFNNLISNAIKFSFPGSTIRVKVYLSKVDVNIVCIAVSDTGIGIPPVLLDNIFREDFKTTRRGTNGEKGTGFGMPLVKAYVEEYGGKIEVKSLTKEDSEKKHGTTFTIYLHRAD